jgi:endonuclease/exonuclease/phosphatase family metal-dependent hydrolase|tara:strand:+ start:143 stop:412 length:270 start_codon:yes stop_codon:yes gene_type:complete
MSSIKIVNFNIQYGLNFSKKWYHLNPARWLRPKMSTLRKMTAALEGYDPDIIGLLEVDGDTIRSKVHQAEYMGERMGWVLLMVLNIWDP